jgi:hypothetical protein
MSAGIERRAKKSKGGAGPWDSRNGRRRPCLSAERKMQAAWQGWSPPGDAGGDRKNARGVTAIRQVTGANLAYHFLPATRRLAILTGILCFKQYSMYVVKKRRAGRVVRNLQRDPLVTCKTVRNRVAQLEEWLTRYTFSIITDTAHHILWPNSYVAKLLLTHRIILHILRTQKGSSVFGQGG